LLEGEIEIEKKNFKNYKTPLLIGLMLKVEIEKKILKFMRLIYNPIEKY